jgi:hypothetical protein
VATLAILVGIARSCALAGVVSGRAPSELASPVQIVIDVGLDSRGIASNRKP